jgi:uncharacterized membrane protein
MRKKQQYFLYFSPLIIFFANDFVRNNLRPKYGADKYELLSVILGWLPNYLAGLGFVLLGLAAAKLISEINKRRISHKHLLWFVTLVSVISAAGLIWWEFEQKSGKLIYDMNDIFATIGGVLSGYVAFLILLFKDSFGSEVNTDNN